MRFAKALFFFLSSLGISCVFAGDQLLVQMRLLETNEEIGVISIQMSKYGMVLTPRLSKLSPGSHGFHLHQFPDCSDKEKNGKLVHGLAAGGHYDPDNTGHHEGPWGNGHKGDLPALFVDNDGNANLPVLAPRLAMQDVGNRALVIHAAGDNYSDTPKPLGGGGRRVACGVTPKN